MKTNILAKKAATVLTALLCTFLLPVQAENRWQLTEDGGICWNVGQNLPHEDHIEMSGRRVSVVLRYGVGADGSLIMNKSMVWPMLRTIPNNTHASLMRRFSWDAVQHIVVKVRLASRRKV